MGWRHAVLAVGLAVGLSLLGCGPLQLAGAAAEAARPVAAAFRAWVGSLMFAAPEAPDSLDALLRNVTSDPAQFVGLLEEFFATQSDGEAVEGRFKEYLAWKAANNSMAGVERFLDWILYAYKFVLPIVIVKLLGGGEGGGKAYDENLRPPSPESSGRIVKRME